MKRRVALLMAVTATMACAVNPLIMTRPANVEAGGLDCVRVTLQRLGYMITAGDRSLGFVRAERQRTREDFPTGRLITDALVVNYISAGTVEDSPDKETFRERLRTTVVSLDLHHGEITDIAA